MSLSKGKERGVMRQNTEGEQWLGREKAQGSCKSSQRRTYQLWYSFEGRGKGKAGRVDVLGERSREGRRVLGGAKRLAPSRAASREKKCELWGRIGIRSSTEKEERPNAFAQSFGEKRDSYLVNYLTNRLVKSKRRKSTFNAWY